jgi:hypothetical protein
MIIDRRALLKSGAAFSGAALLPGLSARALNQTEFDIERFVFDSRFDRAVEAARGAAAQRIPLCEVSGDLTSLWYNDLNLQWKQRPMTLAGVTGEDALFVLATLAPEYRMRVVRRAEAGAAAVSGPAGMQLLHLYSWVIAGMAQSYG